MYPLNTHDKIQSVGNEPIYKIAKIVIMARNISVRQRSVLMPCLSQFPAPRCPREPPPAQMTMKQTGNLRAEGRAPCKLLKLLNIHSIDVNGSVKTSPGLRRCILALIKDWKRNKWKCRRNISIQCETRLSCRSRATDWRWEDYTREYLYL